MVFVKAAYLCLVAQAVGAINPDIFGENVASLVKFHVLGQLGEMVRLRSSIAMGGGLTLEALDTMLDSAW